MSYIVKIYTPQELNHSSYVQTGLFELEQESFLQTQVVLSLSKRLGTIKVSNATISETKQPHPKSSFYELIDTVTGEKISFATDLYDASNSFSKYALENCDYVFKRNYEKRYINRLSVDFQKKIVPLGLTFGVHSNHKKQDYKFFWGLLLTNLYIDFKIDGQVFKRLYHSYIRQIKHWSFIKTTRNIQGFEKYTKATENYILFQTRCFSNEDDSDLKNIHQDRYKIILLLRNKFPKLFKGGFIPSAIVNQKYTDAITNLKTDPKSYLDLVKKAKIGIYTRGIQDSPAWKMSEYLSQGKVVIAEKINTELPVSLEHNKQVLFFETIEQIPLLCEQVINDEMLSERLSKNGRAYYENTISPKVNIRRIIEFMIENKKK